MVKVTDILDPQSDVTVLSVTLQVPLQFVVQSAEDLCMLTTPSESYRMVNSQLYFFPLTLN